MGLLTLDALKPGMIVGLDVSDANGQILLRHGMQLTERHLRILRAWGVTQVDIEGEQNVDPEELLIQSADPALLQKVEEQVASLFCNANIDHSAVKELQKIAVLQAIRRAVGVIP